ncbi:hypothetical protein HMPREF0352_2184 [Enterococcus faecium TX1330]|nr:hypothetical protein HMPREF0352_2184 [Enterococcus faecium TX1330]
MSYFSYTFYLTNRRKKAVTKVLSQSLIPNKRCSPDNSSATTSILTINL